MDDVAVGICCSGIVEGIACEVGTVGPCGVMATESIGGIDVDNCVGHEPSDLDGGIGADEVAQNARWVAIPKERAESLASFDDSAIRSFV